jgi:hypothetical protein
LLGLSIFTVFLSKLGAMVFDHNIANLPVISVKNRETLARLAYLFIGHALPQRNREAR